MVPFRAVQNTAGVNCPDKGFPGCAQMVVVWWDSYLVPFKTLLKGALISIPVQVSTIGPGTSNTPHEVVLVWQSLE